MSANDFALPTKWTTERDPEAFRELASRYAAMVYEGAPVLPDFAAMTINEMERFNHETPPVVGTARASEAFDGLDPGTHTVVVIAPGGEIRGEDHVLPGLRYGMTTVDVKERADVTASVTLR